MELPDPAHGSLVSHGQESDARDLAEKTVALLG